MEYVGSDGKPTALTESQVGSKNITTKFRDAFETYNPSPTGTWVETKGTGDLVFVDGNTASASYLVVSKSPFNQGTVTEVETTARFNMPIEMSLGLHMSQRTLGQEFSAELVSTEAALPVPDLTISTISQATTTLTVNTTAPHGLVPGKRIGIFGVSDSRLNYPSLVVASIPSTTQFTCTAGPGGNLPSVTVGPLSGGAVFFRSTLGFASDGASMLFENATATNASFYLRSAFGDALPSGTIAGSHSVTVGTSASVQSVNAAYSYSFFPTSEYRLTTLADKVQWADSSVDSTGATTARATRTQVVPGLDKEYKFRIRATNNKSLTVPIATIVSATKSGTTTATVVFDRPHGLTVADQVVLYGVRDQVNFANLTAATAIASIVDTTTITLIWGSAVTATSFGGYVAKVNGGNLMSSLGAVAQAVQSATLTNGILTLVGSATWSGLLIGDTCNVFGVRNGVVPGVDGAYRVRSIATTNLELERIDGIANPADFVSASFGGAVIKRTDLRLSFIRIFDFERQRVELLARPTGDQSSAAPVTVQNTLSAAQSGTWTVGLSASQTLGTVTALTGGGAAEDAAATTNPVVVGGVVRTAVAPTTLVAGDAARLTLTGSGAAVFKPYAVPETDWQHDPLPGGILNSTVAVTVNTAPGASLRNYITALDLYWDTLTNASDLVIRSANITCASQTIASNTLTTSAAHGLAIGDSIVPSASTVTGLTAGTRYFVLTTPSTTTLTLSATKGGTTLAISGTSVTATLNQILYRTKVGTATGSRDVNFPTPLRGAVNQAVEVVTLTASGAGAVYPHISGYIGT
jgi:hypothetical protein